MEGIGKAVRSTPRSVGVLPFGIPLRARRRPIGGVLRLQSECDQFLAYDDEDALTRLAAQLAQALVVLRSIADPDGSAAEADADPIPRARDPAVIRVRHYRQDHSVFVDDTYLIKGVAGAILWKIAGEHVARGRSEFTTRELRLAADELGLPDVQDNLGVRLLLLERRLAERDVGITLQRSGRGRFRLVTSGPLRLFAEGED
ncbi:MAG: hypothetical protein ABWX83_01705 [Luteibacter sp.]